MKKLLISGAVLSMFVALPAFAQIQIDQRESDGTFNSRKTTLHDAVEAKKTELKDAQERLRVTAEKARAEATTTRKEVRNIKDDFRADVAKVRTTVVGRVFNATIARFEKIITRIESRMARIEASGGNTTEAKAFVATAKGNIADAKVQMALIQGIDLRSASTTQARANFDKIKTAAKAARDLLSQAKQNLQKAINALAKWEKEHKSGATTTTSAEIH